MQPATANNPPTMLSEVLLISPAMTSVNPSASRPGHALGAGKGTSVGVEEVPGFDSCSGLILLSFLVAKRYRPTRYTTVKTTTHTASTKCQ